MLLRRVIQNILMFLQIDFPFEQEMRSPPVNNIGEDDIMYNDFIQWTD